MGCIEIPVLFPALPMLIWINRNMGCIEILKPNLFRCPANMINRNMGCIEIRECVEILWISKKINRNMGCIEIILDIMGMSIYID